MLLILILILKIKLPAPVLWITRVSVKASLQPRVTLKEFGFIVITGGGIPTPERQINVSATLLNILKVSKNVATEGGINVTTTLTESYSSIVKEVEELTVYADVALVILLTVTGVHL